VRQLNSENMYITKSMKTTVRLQKTLHFIYTTIEPNFVDIPEIHDFWEFVYLESGEAVVSIDGVDTPLLAGEVIFHKPGEVHSIKAYNGTINAFFISFHSSSKIMSLLSGLKISLTSEQKKLIYRIYDEAKNIFFKGSRPSDPTAFVSKALLSDVPLGAQQLYRIYLEQFLIICAREKEKYITIYDSKEDFEKAIVEKILEIMDEKLYSSFSLNQLCHTLHYGKTYISAIFKKHKNTSVMSFYNSLKIKEAKKLLSKYSVSQTAQMLDFNNPYYFAKVFKKHEGLTPSEYKHRA